MCKLQRDCNLKRDCAEGGRRMVSTLWSRRGWGSCAQSHRRHRANAGRSLWVVGTQCPKALRGSVCVRPLLLRFGKKSMVQSNWLNIRAAVSVSFGATNAHTRSSCAAAWAEAVMTITRTSNTPHYKRTSNTPHYVPPCQCVATNRGNNEWRGLQAPVPEKACGRGLGTREMLWSTHSAAHMQ